MPQYKVKRRDQLNKRYTLISDAAMQHHYIRQLCYHRDQMQLKPWAANETLTYVANTRTPEAIGKLTANCSVTDRLLSGLATAKLHIQATNSTGSTSPLNEIRKEIRCKWNPCSPRVNFIRRVSGK